MERRPDHLPRLGLAKGLPLDGKGDAVARRELLVIREGHQEDEPPDG
ncbi:hypothetical protein [Micromonospora rubida]|nr:hypothetical protein [Micromonospora rubida]NBE82584.1 hypothetical protein [Micromonospora rubida]